MPKHSSPVPLIIIALALLALGLGAFAYQNIGDAVAGIPESRLPKTVYTGDATSTQPTPAPTGLTPSP